MLSITHSLVQRLEAAEAADGADCAESQKLLNPESDAAVKAVAGGFLIYLGVTSPLTHVLNLGLSGPVTQDDLNEVEEFYRERGAPVIIDVCPYADVSLLELLNDRDYKISEMNNVLVRDVQADMEIPDFSPGIEVRQCDGGECELYTETTVKGFFGRELVSDDELAVGRALFNMRGATSYLAFSGSDPAGSGSMSIRYKVASCFGDSTQPAFRGKGIQAALIRARMLDAAKGNCDVVTAGTQPGSQSQRNYERLGFQVAYTKITMVLE